MINLKGRVYLACLTDDGKIRWEVEGDNIITQLGDQYYAERATGIASPPAQITGMQLGTSTTAASKTGAGAAIGSYISGSATAFDATYPQSSLNGSSRRITWRATWVAGRATNGAITEVALVNQNIATDSAAPEANTISRIVFGAKAKSATDTLVISWTHDLLGA